MYLIFLMSNFSLNSDAAGCGTCRDGLVAVDRCSHSVFLFPTKKVKQSVCLLT